MLKELKEVKLNEVKENITMSHQIDNFNKEIEINLKEIT